MAIFNVDFFRTIELGSHQLIDISPLFASLAKSDNDDPGRFVPYGNTHYIRLYRIASRKSLWMGDLIRIRMDEIPVRAPLRGDIAPFELEDEEGVGEPTAFMYDPKLRIVALQRNGHGVSAVGFTWFVNQTADASIRLAPVLKTDGLQRVMNLKRIGALEVHFAGVHDPSKLQAGGPASVRTMGSLLQEFGAPSGSFRLSAGRGGWSLNLNAAKSSVQRLFGLSETTEITKVEIVGSDSEDSRDVIDLLKLRMSAKIPVDQKARTMEYSDRIQALQAAWTNSIGELRQLFEP